MILSSDKEVSSSPSPELSRGNTWKEVLRVLNDGGMDAENLRFGEVGVFKRSMGKESRKSAYRSS